MKRFLQEHWPVVGAIAIYWLTLVILLTMSLAMTQGRLIYALDDTYIHMAMARNAVQHGVWGVTRYEFASATSSPLWTLLLAASYGISGVNEISPLVLNILFGTLALLVSHVFLRPYVASRRILFIILLAALFGTPLPSLTFAGMEHTLHALLTLSFVATYMATLSPASERKGWMPLIVLAPLLAMTRYEGLFLVGVVCILFALRRRALTAGMLAGAALLPVMAYGMWSISKGWYFLPNSILLKGARPSSTIKGAVKLLSGYDLILKVLADPHILCLLIASLFLLLFILKKSSMADPRVQALVIVVGATLVHMQVAATGWFYRYEAYLIFLGIVIVGACIRDLLPRAIVWQRDREMLPRYAVGAALALLMASPLVVRAYDAWGRTPYAIKNIYEQQYQMGRFLARWYQGEAVAVKDIGAVTYLADIKLLDLWGLGSIEPARLRMQKVYTIDQIYSLAGERGVTISIVYDKWFELGEVGELPTRWSRVGQWRVSKNFVLGDDTVSFYAVSPEARDRLVQNLKTFANELPGDVIQSGRYADRKPFTAPD